METDLSQLNKQERVFTYLKEHGSVEPIEAWRELGVYKLSAVILELRKAGHEIVTERRNSLNRFGELCNFAHYVLEDKDGNS